MIKSIAENELMNGYLPLMNSVSFSLHPRRRVFSRPKETLATTCGTPISAANKFNFPLNLYRSVVGFWHSMQAANVEKSSAFFKCLVSLGL